MSKTQLFWKKNTQSRFVSVVSQLFALDNVTQYIILTLQTAVRLNFRRLFKFFEAFQFDEFQGVSANINLEFVKNGTTLENENPKIILKNFTTMEKASSNLYVKLDAMIEEFISNKNS